ncbi:MAG: glycosyltransferase family 4 protein [Chloroflexi bacterium]|nr:MAG: glycosyltransferase family 4 protein [Chloroflexota bacterium]
MARTPGPDDRVLIDARALQGPDALRGIGSYVRGLITGLLEEGFDSSTALLFDAGLPLPPLPAGDFVARTVRRRYRGRAGRIEDAIAMEGDLGRFRPPVYHATTLALPGRSPVPVVATVHDLIPWALGGWSQLGERSRWWLGRRLLSRADLVLAVSEATARDVRRLARVPESRIEVVPEGLAPGFTPAAGAAERVAERHGLGRRLRPPDRRGAGPPGAAVDGRGADARQGHRRGAGRPPLGGRLPAVPDPLRRLRPPRPGGDGLRLPGGHVPQLQPARGGRRRGGARRGRRRGRAGPGGGRRRGARGRGRAAAQGRPGAGQAVHLGEDGAGHHRGLRARGRRGPSGGQRRDIRPNPVERRPAGPTGRSAIMQSL